jgi:signal transduction histidine kinase
MYDSAGVCMPACICNQPCTQGLKFIWDKLSSATELQRSSVKAWCDEEAVKRILMNLVSNALKFTQQGSITLQVQ